VTNKNGLCTGDAASFLGKQFTPYRAIKTKRYSSTLSLTSALDVDSWGNTTPRPFYPRERDLIQEAGWAWSQSGQLPKIFPTPAFEPSSYSRCTDCGIPAAVV